MTLRRNSSATRSRSPSDDPLAPYLESLAGGDAARGAAILSGKAEVSCIRCHKIDGNGGEVGPDLTGIGKRQDRRYLLEAIVAPNRQIAKGFETLVIATSDGQVQSGILKEDDGTNLRLITAEGKTPHRPQGRHRGTEARRLGHARRPPQAPLAVRAPRPGRVPGAIEVMESRILIA